MFIDSYSVSIATKKSENNYEFHVPHFQRLNLSQLLVRMKWVHLYFICVYFYQQKFFT